MTHEEFAVERLAIIIHDAMCPDANGDMMTWPAEVFTTARSVHAAGYRRPRTITTAEELDALPEGSVILAESTGDSYQKNHEDEWFIWGGGGRDAADVDLPATVLHEPEQP